MVENVVSIKFDLLHAERLAEVQGGAQVQLAINLNIHGEKLIRRHDRIEIPFTVHVSSTPPTINMTIRGTAQISGGNLREIEEALLRGNVPAQVSTAIMQAGLFEAGLLMRELGFPPAIPVPQPQQRKESGVSYA